VKRVFRDEWGDRFCIMRDREDGLYYIVKDYGAGWGQVSNTFKTKKRAEAAIRRMVKPGPVVRSRSKRTPAKMRENPMTKKQMMWTGGLLAGAAALTAGVVYFTGGTSKASVTPPGPSVQGGGGGGGNGGTVVAGGGGGPVSSDQGQNVSTTG